MCGEPRTGVTTDRAISYSGFQAACGHRVFRGGHYIWDAERELGYCSPQCADEARERERQEHDEGVIRFLLDGLAVRDLAELRTLVEKGRREPDLARVRGAIRDLLHACLRDGRESLLPRDQLLAVGQLHRVDAEELLQAGVTLPPRSDDAPIRASGTGRGDNHERGGSA